MEVRGRIRKVPVRTSSLRWKRCGSDSPLSNDSSMAAHAARLARLFTPEYARRINAQIVHPEQSVVVKPNELESSLSRPLHVAVYEPHRPPSYLAATLSYGIIKGKLSRV